jgi:hypothetical protein
MSLMSVQAAIIQELQVKYPLIPIKYENVGFDPQGKAIYFQVISEEVRSTRITLGHHSAGSKRRAGRVTIIVVGQAGVGDGQVKNTSQAIREHFESKVINGAFFDVVNILTIGNTAEGYIQSVVLDFTTYAF